MMHTCHTISRFFLPATLLLTITCSGAVFAGSYKWADDEGAVYYGDRVPPEYSSIERKVLNEQGITIRVYDAAKTPEEIEEEERRAKQMVEEKRRARMQAMYDHTLLATYTNVQDMVTTRDGKIAAIDGIIRLTMSRIENIKSRLQAMTDEAADIERSGKPFPEQLHQQIRETRAQILDNERYILNKQREQEAIRQQFEANILRFRELKAETGVAASE